MTERAAAGQTLLIDADDTLWENNIYFERAIASFISYLDHREHSPAEVRERLNAVERESIAAHGYGLGSFQRSLVTCFERLSSTAATPENHARIESFARSVAEAEIELLPGVAELLPELGRRHRLILMTKGNEGEQADKLSRSGLGHHFSAIEIPREKDPGAYADVIRRHGLDPARTWMIGNSPKSDINPALAAGLHACYIHHAETWVLERAALDQPRAGRTLLEVRSFAELAEYF
jgi:putative hydrolase of the HAD superfamily